MATGPGFVALLPGGRRSAPETPGDSDESDSCSTSEEERIKKLFQTCDEDGDGYINSHDMRLICRQLNMEDAVEDIMAQLGTDTKGRISFAEFVRCGVQLRNEIDAALRVEDDVAHVPRHLPLATGLLGSPHWTSDNSLGITSLKPGDSWEFDSGARDLSPEPNPFLQKLLEAVGGGVAINSANLLHLANKLHLGALASLKGEILDLNHRLQHIAQERDILEKQLTKSQVQIKFEKLRMVRDHEDHLDQQAQRYEERLTELHSVIAELSKKIDGHRGNIIREEEECSHQSGESCSHGTSNYNNPNESCTDNEDISGEVQQVPMNGCDNHSEDQQPVHKETSTSPLPADCDSIEERATQVCKEMEALRFSPPNRTATGHHSVQMQEELMVLRSENVTLQEQLGRQEAELNKAKAALGSQQEERDRLRRKVRDLQSKLQAVLSQSSLASQNGSPTHGKTAGNNSLASERASSCEDAPIAKIAERVRLKKMESGDRQILGSEITSLGVSSSKVAEHLVHPLQEESRSQEIYQELYSSGSQIPVSRIREFEVETERLSSRIEHLKSQNDLLSLTLEESKCQCDRLSVLIGKYESNNTALQLALRYTDQALEAYDVLTALMETETGLLLANCRAAGLGSIVKHITDGVIANENDEVAAILKRATENRRSAEAIARHLLVQLDRNCDIMCGVMGCTASPWEDLSSHSCTTSTTTSTSSSYDTDFSKSEEQRLRDHITQLKHDRASVRTTVLELESVHIDPMVREPSSALDSQKLDLENAVLMQELTAMKEEKADLKAQVYLLERERASLELRLSSQDAQEQAYLAHIEHLKSEVKEQQEASEKLSEGCKRHLQNGGDTSEVTDDLGHELAEALKREKKLKLRLQELVSTIEKVNKNSELRHQQSAEFVNDLKRANSALVAAFEKSKKKYQAKIKKMEHQMLLMVDRHSAQMRLLKQRITMLEEADSACRSLQPATSQTSL